MESIWLFIVVFSPAMAMMLFAIRNIVIARNRPIGIPSLVASCTCAPFVSGWLVHVSEVHSDVRDVYMITAVTLFTLPFLYVAFYLHGIAVRRLLSTTGS